MWPHHPSASTYALRHTHVMACTLNDFYNHIVFNIYVQRSPAPHSHKHPWLFTLSYLPCSCGQQGRSGACRSYTDAGGEGRGGEGWSEIGEPRPRPPCPQAPFFYLVLLLPGQAVAECREEGESLLLFRRGQVPKLTGTENMDSPHTNIVTLLVFSSGLFQNSSPGSREFWSPPGMIISLHPVQFHGPW